MAHETDEELQGFLTFLNSVKKGEDEVVRFEGQLCHARNEDLREEVLYEAHHSKYTIHPGVTKMKRMYWCPGMKKDVAEFLDK